jgi:hypothetical protein
MTYDTEHGSTCLLAVCVRFLVRHLLMLSAHFLWKKILTVLCIFWKLGLSVFCRYFLPVHYLSFHSLDSAFQGAENFNLNEVQLSFLSPGSAFGIYLKLLANLRSLRFHSILSLKHFTVSHFTFRAVIHLEVILGACEVCV